MHTTTAPTAAAPTRSHSRDTQGDYLLQPPSPAQRVPGRVGPADMRRLELLALLTAAGIAPCAGDRAAIDRLGELPGSVHTALHRWLEQAHGFRG